MLQVINVYELVVSLICLYLFGNSLFGALKNNEIDSVFVGLIAIAVMICLLYSNILLLLKKVNRKKLIIQNIWINGFQCIYISLMGVTYYFVTGFQFLPYFSYDEKMKL